jgi:hypothetical protein
LSKVCVQQKLSLNRAFSRFIARAFALTGRQRAKLYKTKTRMPKRTKNRDRVRTPPGVVTIKPNSPNEWFTTPVTGQPYWKVRAQAPWGQRLRKRPETWEAATTLRKEWEDKFAEWNEKHKDRTLPRVVVVKENIDETRLTELRRALALLPKDKNDRPDPEAKIDEGIEHARKHGWPSDASKTKVKDVVPEFLERSAYRAKLKWQEPYHIQPNTLIAHRFNARLCLRFFGEEAITAINSAERQEALLENWEKHHGQLLPHTKMGALNFLSILLHWLKRKGKVPFVSIMSHTVKRVARPRAMTILEQQNFIDKLYNTKMAAAGYARFYLGVRPWSELKESALEEEYGLSLDCKTFMVPLDGKTGFRPVPCQPVAILVFKELLAQGRLYKRIHPKGFYILDHCNISAWTALYGRCGYHVSVHTMKRGMPKELHKMSDVHMINWYRAAHPLSDWASRDGTEPGKVVTSYVEGYWDLGMWWVADYLRHTEISAYMNVTDGAMDRAITRYGNSDEIIRGHYRDFMSLADSILHYQLIPTALKGKYNADEIPLPNWCKFDFNSLDPEVLKEIAEKRALLPKFDSQKNYRQKWGGSDWSGMSPEARSKRVKKLRANWTAWHEARMAKLDKTQKTTTKQPVKATGKEQNTQEQ